MLPPDSLGPSHPKLVLYLPHRPNGLEQFRDRPSAQALVAANSNHWRKIVTLLAKIAGPVAADWRTFKDNELFQHTALCFAPQIVDMPVWHWIGGKDNLQRFEFLPLQAQPLADAPEVLLDTGKRLLLTPYPDYRQLSNRLVGLIRTALGAEGFYDR